MFGIIGVEKSPGTVATYCKRFPGTQKNQPLKILILILFPRKNHLNDIRLARQPQKKVCLV